MSKADTSNVTATVSKGKTYDTGFADASAEGNPWFPQLPAAKQVEVVKYAVLHLANNSSLLERNEQGCNDRDYERITIAIARSGVGDAETIFVEAASSANGAAPQDDLRKFFQAHSGGNPDTDGITVGTLLNIARQYGADFNRWEATSDNRGREVLNSPGNEEECRKQIDIIVAADPQTFTLGDPTGPLVILRVPKKEQLPAKTKWDGDLPGTTLATPADIMQRAERLKWLQRAGGRGEDRFVRTGPPRAFVAEWLQQMRGQYRASPLQGITRVPRIDDNGIIHFISGYDPITGLFHDRITSFHVPLKPSRDDARKAAEVLWIPSRNTISMIRSWGKRCCSRQNSPQLSGHSCPSLRCMSYAARCRAPAKG